jgi:hypothetical protein
MKYLDAFVANKNRRTSAQAHLRGALRAERTGDVRLCRIIAVARLLQLRGALADNPASCNYDA